MRKYLTWRNAAGVVFALGAVAMLSGYWQVQQQKVNDLQQRIDQLPDAKDKVSLVKDRIALENTIAGSLIQTVGGLLLFVTAHVSLQTLKATQRNVLVAEEKQVTERFTQAINQLGNENNVTVRLGGIYALERIAKDSEKDHWTIMEVLTSFVQNNSPTQDAVFDDETGELLSPTEWRKGVATDVQAALTVIGRRDSERDREGVSLNLNSTGLAGADLPYADFVGAKIIKANLQQANLRKAKLSRTMFYDSKLCNANLDEANLVQAIFIDANLYGAKLMGAMLNRADFTRANLASANLSMAALDGANFYNANLNRAYLKKVQGLTPEQVKAARNWKTAYYDDDFRQKLGLLPEKKS